MPYHYHSSTEWWEEPLWWVLTLPFKIIWWVITIPIMLVVRLVRQSPEQKLQAPAEADTQGQVIQAIECSVCHEYNEATSTICYSCSAPL